MLHDGFIYLWGFHNKHLVLAQVPANLPHLRYEYRYWNGFGYVENISHAKQIMAGMQQGAIIKSNLFGKEKPWVVVGCTCWGDSKLMIGAAESLEGPWELTQVTDATGIDVPSGFMYCMYPHVWASEAEKGQLAVSWSEHWPGGVVMAKLTFAMRKSLH